MTTDRPTIDPTRARTATTEELRDAFLLENLFVDGEAHAAHTAEDRMVVAGVVPGTGELSLPELPALGAEGYSRREFGVINIGEAGEVVVDGEVYSLEHRDGLYAGRGAQLSFRGEGARFYVVAVLAHSDNKTVHIPFAQSEPLMIGDTAGAGRRGLHRYVWGDGPVASSQLQFGITVLEEGSVWNTFPAHLHERRTEIYLYFELDPAGAVVHLMGEPAHTRHLIVRNEQAVISPRWSIHSGAGTGRYTFIWAMAGDNRDYGDLAGVPTEELR
ncbi:5-dehydro-4-deoxy-D-glucuronate isomerase [Microbacterium sp. NIBRBAC000506063]|uniref:5-dehydro-4-deoxy-D-glucuronate isomerase n=1 Tax=Microbacterium sp. NIBRBAC000506063 TaxID=2734618 RepID=UPI001BB4D5F6|nr:5-dehydro-4-deoxy-D-glucuronate isomerase [Microbacterium sp. NIBRBAC000506063]QTV80387.1 5-dehydro-4-deoxy-D-glucuronate isomerase [Microbacterium sp. NIBRBAC000506063]